MYLSVLRRVAAVSSIAILAACTSQPEITRAEVWQVVGEKRTLTSVAREFMRAAPYAVHFEFDKSELTEKARADLNEQADWIAEHPTVKFSVYGHTDKVGTNLYNQELGRDRAEAVIEYLVSRGVDINQLELQLSLGETAPILNVEERAEVNRRATTFVAGRLSKPEIASAESDNARIPERPQNPEEPEKPREEPEKPREEPEKPREEPEKPREEPEKPREEPEKPREEPEKPREEPEKPREEPEKPEAEQERPNGGAENKKADPA